MKDKQPPLYLFTGLVIGILLGLLVAYVILPVRYSNTDPGTLTTGQKEVYRGLVARAYLYEADQNRAFSRLALLKEENLDASLVEQAQQLVAGNGDTTTARGLALLASAMTNGTVAITPLAAIQVPAATETVDVTKNPVATNTTIPPTSTPFATYTPRPTVTPTPTQGTPYQLVDEPRDICDAKADTPLLMVYVYDKNGEGVSGVKIQISITDGGQSEFYTGFYPQINTGYADYEMMSGVTYSIRVGDGGENVSGLSIPQCKAKDGSTFSGSLEIKFKQS